MATKSFLKYFLFVQNVSYLNIAPFTRSNDAGWTFVN